MQDAGVVGACHFKGERHLKKSIRFKKKELRSSMRYCHCSL